MKRSEINEKYKWNISDVYKNDEEFYKECEILEKEIDFSEFKGKLNNALCVGECYKKLYALFLKLEKKGILY